MISFNRQDIALLEKQYRTSFVNSLSGYKAANLIGSTDKDGQENLAIFSSVVHLGAQPALLGFVMRPAAVERHTYENIRSTGYFTINAVTGSMSARAHSTSARYPRSVSEFDACGIEREYIGEFNAPFVKESPLRIGCLYREELQISANNTILIVGEIVEVHLDEALLQDDGYVDLVRADITAISALDAYHTVGSPVRYAYAKPDTAIKKIN